MRFTFVLLAALTCFSCKRDRPDWAKPPENGGVQGDGGVGGELLRLTKGEDVLDPFAGHAGAHQTRRAGGA